ncbi:MAG: hypothetical protein RMJ98_13995 [Myxococcales bacterium]|nr:hypothetical protein [Polyangiaceae bacterium]MDW8250403.1 hypothetical protein [Myxococcales bacterium]
MKTGLLARLLLVTGGVLPSLVSGCSGDEREAGTAQTTPGNRGATGSGGASGAGGSAAGNSINVGGSGGSGGSGGVQAGAGGFGQGVGGGQGGAGGGAGDAGGTICVKTEVCIQGKIMKICIEPPGDPAPYTDCGDGTCVEDPKTCPGTSGAGGGGGAGGNGGVAGSAGSGAGAGGSEGGNGGGAAAGVPCMEGGACVEEAWCGNGDTGKVLRCTGGKYQPTEPSFQNIKVCTEKAAEAPCLAPEDIELLAKIQEEYSASCLGVQDASKPPIQKASNGIERCCYEVFAICVGRPLFLGTQLRIAPLQSGVAWS